jgi:hypothetical protein
VHLLGVVLCLDGWWSYSGNICRHPRLSHTYILCLYLYFVSTDLTMNMFDIMPLVRRWGVPLLNYALVPGAAAALVVALRALEPGRPVPPRCSHARVNALNACWPSMRVSGADAVRAVVCCADPGLMGRCVA